MYPASHVVFVPRSDEYRTQHDVISYMRHLQGQCPWEYRIIVDFFFVIGTMVYLPYFEKQKLT